MADLAVNQSGEPPTVASVMTRAVITVTPDTSVEAAAEMLNENHITGMPVVDEYLHVVGVVSEIDIVVKYGGLVGEIMTAEPRVVEESLALSDAAAILMEQRIRRLPVVRHGKLVGLVSRTDLVTFFARHQWICPSCGTPQRGLRPPDVCPSCGAEREGFRLEDAPHGM